MNKLVTGLLILLSGMSSSLAATGPVISGLPSSLAVGDTVVISASGGTAPYSWSSSTAGVTVTALNATEARLVVHSSALDVTITVYDALALFAAYSLDTYSYTVRIGDGSFLNGDTLQLPVYYTNRTVAANLLSADIVLPIDTAVFTFIGLQFSGTLLASQAPTGVFNRIQDTLRIGIANTYPLGPVSTESILFFLRFTNTVPVSSGQTRPLYFTGFVVNETLEGVRKSGSLTVDPVPNYSPVFVNPPGDTTISEGTVLVRSYAATDANGDPLKYYLTQNFGGGDAEIDSLTGQFTFSPDYFSASSYGFEVTAMDSLGAAAQFFFTVSVTNVNRYPYFITVFPDSFIVREGESFWLDVAAADPDLTPVYFSLINAPGGMTIDSVSGEIDWTPSFDSAGVYFPIIEVHDQLGGFDTAVLKFFVADSNRAPMIVTAPNDTMIVETIPYSAQLTAVDPDLDSLRYEIQSGAPPGMEIDSLTGAVTYTPGIADSGDYTVTLVVSDGRPYGEIFHTYFLHVLHQNQPPAVIVDFPDTVFLAETQPFFYDFSASDPDGDAVRFFLSEHPPGMSIDSLTGEAEWTPDYFQSGIYVPKVVVHDLHGGFGIDSLVIVVANTNRDPEFVVFPDSLYFMEGQAISFFLPAFDPDGDSLRYSESGAPFGMAVDSITGEVTWTPDYTTGNIIYPVTFIVHDEYLASDAATKYFLVIDSNRTPVLTVVPNDTTIVEGVLYSAQVTATDVDAGEQLRYYVQSGHPPLFELDSITGAISWTPDNSHEGVYPVTIVVTDFKPFGTVTHSFTITVTNVNVDPVIVSGFPDTLHAAENQLFTIDIDAVDSDGNPIEYTVIDAPSGLTIHPVTGVVQWLPDYSQAGVYHPTIKATDSLGGFDSRYFVLIVHNVNRLPQFTGVLPDTVIAENELLAFQYEGEDSDLDSLKFILMSPVPGMTFDTTGALEWRPTFSQAGKETLIVALTDYIDFVMDTAIVTVLNANFPPEFITAMDDTSIARFDTLRFQYDAGDPDNDPIGYTLWTGPPGATVTDDGFLEWIPPADANGVYLFIIGLSDSVTTEFDTARVRVFRLGDVSGNGVITSFDGSMILRDQVEAIELNTVQSKVADVSGDTTLTSYDASLILQYVVGLITNFPAGFAKQQEMQGVLSAFAFTIQSSANEGEYDLLVRITKPSQVFGITMSLGFDTNIVVPKAMKQTALSDSMFMASFFPKGKANLALAGTKPMNTAGDIARFTFTLKEGSVPGNSVLFTMKKFILNETDYTNDIAGIAMDVKNASLLPETFSIEQNFPNPFNPATTINYQLPKESDVTVTIYNMIGQEVRSLVDASQPPGYYSVLWNGRDNNNAPVSSGVYLYKIIAQSGGKNVFVHTKKMVFLK